MKFTKIIFLLSLLFILSNAQGQAVITFNQDHFDFGQVAEGTQATHEFKFKNEGDAPLILNKVQASCGCTTPFWTKDPIQPGGEGVITASYNSKGRPGAFNKSITITSNASTPTARVYIKGTVVPTSKAGVVYSQEALDKAAKASLEREIINLGKVELGHAVPVQVVVENNGKSNLIISNLQSACNCLYLSPESSSIIHPGKSGTLQMVYKAKDTGRKAATAVLLTNDLKNPETKIVIHADVVESLSKSSMLKEQGTKFSF